MSQQTDLQALIGKTTRFRELAVQGAERQHEDDSLFEEGRGGHEGNFEVCAHPDCVLVRSLAAAAPVAPQGKGKQVCAACGHYRDTHANGACCGWMAGGVAFTSDRCPCTTFKERLAAVAEAGADPRQQKKLAHEEND